MCRGDFGSARLQNSTGRQSAVITAHTVPGVLTIRSIRAFRRIGLRRSVSEHRCHGPAPARPGMTASRRQQTAAAVFFNMLRIVAAMGAQIQRIIRRHANTANTGRTTAPHTLAGSATAGQLVYVITSQYHPYGLQNRRASPRSARPYLVGSVRATPFQCLRSGDTDATWWRAAPDGRTYAAR